MSGLPKSHITDRASAENFIWIEAEIQRLKQNAANLNTQITALERFASGFVPPNNDLLQPAVETRAIQQTDTIEYGYVYIWIPAHAERLGTVQARSRSILPPQSGDAWTTLSVQSGPGTGLAAILPNDENWSGDYYFHRQALETTNKSNQSYVQVRVTNVNDEIVYSNSYVFDADKNPDIKSWSLLPGTYDVANDKWPYSLAYRLDEDGASLEWAIHTSSVSDPPSDASYSGGAFNGCINAAQSDATSLDNLTPDTQYYFIARARGGASCTGDKGIAPDGVINHSFRTPKLGKGVIPIEWLWQSMFQGTYDAEFSWHATDPYRRIQWDAGTWTYANAPADTSYNQTYSINAGNRILNTTPTLEFCYFDPDVAVNDFQWTTTFTDVVPTEANPYRVYIGMAKAASSTNSRAFFLANGTTNPLISAVYANFGSLTALFAVISTLDIEDSLILATGGEIRDSGTNFKATDNGFWVKQVTSLPTDPTDPKVYSLGDDAFIATWTSVANAFANEIYIRADDKGGGQVGKITLSVEGTGAEIVVSGATLFIDADIDLQEDFEQVSGKNFGALGATPAAQQAAFDRPTSGTTCSLVACLHILEMHEPCSSHQRESKNFQTSPCQEECPE